MSNKKRFFVDDAIDRMSPKEKKFRTAIKQNSLCFVMTGHIHIHIYTPNLSFSFSFGAFRSRFNVLIQCVMKLLTSRRSGDNSASINAKSFNYTIVHNEPRCEWCALMFVARSLQRKTFISKKNFSLIKILREWSNLCLTQHAEESINTTTELKPFLWSNGAWHAGNRLHCST